MKQCINPSYLKTSGFLRQAFSSIKSLLIDLLSLQKFETAECLGQENVAIRKNMIDIFSVHTCDRYLVTRNNVAFLCQR